MRRCKRHEDGALHDCGYVERVNRLIPDAERRANDRTLEAFAVVRFDKSMTPEQKRFWDRAFHEEMNAAAESTARRLGDFLGMILQEVAEAERSTPDTEPLP